MYKNNSMGGRLVSSSRTVSGGQRMALGQDKLDDPAKIQARQIVFGWLMGMNAKKSYAEEAEKLLAHHAEELSSLPEAVRDHVRSLLLQVKKSFHTSIAHNMDTSETRRRGRINRLGYGDILQ